MFSKTLLASTAALSAALVLAACGGGGGSNVHNSPSGDTVLLTASGRLVSLNRASPGTALGSVAVSGLAGGETLLGIDVRPSDGRIYALSSAGRLYTLDPSTGAATLKATLRAASGDDNPYTQLEGSRFGVDFNPVADRLRVVSDTGQNLRINVDTGDALTDGALARSDGAARITAAAYTNSFSGTIATQLFDLDAAAGLRFLQDPPNAGTLADPVALGVSDAAEVNGFDIEARNNRGYAALTVGGKAMLYGIDLSATSNAATALGELPSGGEAVVGLALRQADTARLVGLTAEGRLVGFSPRTPNQLETNVAISGLQQSGERVLGLDFRPADGLLYALSSAGRLYTVDASSGQATLKTTLTADGGDTTSPFAGLAGTSFSVDFNPVADRLRVISDTGQNLRINVDTGATLTDGTINRASAAPTVVAAAYTNSFAGAASTTLFDLEATSDVLARQVPPNEGTLVEVGPVTGFDVRAGSAAFDIAGGGNAAYAALRPGATGPFSLYSVSLTTGAATPAFMNSDATQLQIGGAGGPALLDIAVRF